MGSSSKEVLIVDDQKAIQEVLGDMFSDFSEKNNDSVSFNVTYAVDAFDGFNSLSLKKFDLAIVDLNLPYTQGDSLIVACREKKLINQSIPFILLSGSIEKRRIHQDPSTYFLIKPVKENELNLIIHSILF